VTDANGCVVTDSAIVNSPPLLTLFACNDIIPVSCYGDTTGTAIACVMGGAPPYSYQWIPSGGTTATASNLSPGNYTCLINDSMGCILTAVYTITQPPAITIALSVTDASCSSCCDGFIAVDSVSGGVGGYTYSWSPVSSTADSIGALCVGVYTICVTDLNGCTVCSSDTVSFPSAINTIYSAGNSVSIIPNPFTNELTIVGADGSDIMLYDYTGKEILRTTSNNAETVLKTEGIAAGFYLLRVDASTGSASKGKGATSYKVIKQ
jgi:hypothetical protein